MLQFLQNREDTMKKKLLSALLAALLVLSMIPFAFAGTVAATEPGNVAYLDEANGDDETAVLDDDSAPYGTFKAAYNALCPAGGTIKIVGEYGETQTGNIAGMSVHYGTITITGINDNSRWRLPAEKATDNGNWVKFSGPVVIENICLYAPNPVYLLGNCSKLTMGEGITCQKELNTNLTAAVDGSDLLASIAVMGGTFNAGEHKDTWVTVKSGVYRTVAGGARANSETKTNASYLGTAYLFLEGGSIATVIGTNWGVSYTVENYNPDNPEGNDGEYTVHKQTAGVGGQTYIYAEGADIDKLYIGGQFANTCALRDSIMTYTDGSIRELVSGRTVGRCTVFYGENITLNYAQPNEKFTSSKNDLFTNTLSGKTTTLTKIVDLNVAPLRTGEDEIVYVDSTKGRPQALGTEADPTYQLGLAIAMLGKTGGTIVLKSTTTLLQAETTTEYRYNEPYHAKPIVIKGETSDIQLKTTAPATATQKVSYPLSPTPASSEDWATVKTDFVKNTGIDQYNLCGDTTFENITFSFPVTTYIAANFHHLVIGENVTGSSARLLGGANIHKATANSKTVPVRTVSEGYYAGYALWSDQDTNITVNSGSDWWITGFSRVIDGVGIPNGWVLPYPGTAHITVNNGATVSTIYPAPVNKNDISGSAAVVTVDGGTVATLYNGGESANKRITDSLTFVLRNGATVTGYTQKATPLPAEFAVITDTYEAYQDAKTKFTDAKEFCMIGALGFRFKKNQTEPKIQYGAKLSELAANSESAVVKEFGILIKNETTNSNALEYFASTGEGDLVYQNKIAKKIAYKEDAGINYYSYKPGDDVTFYATLSNLNPDHYSDYEYSFRPYAVLDVAGEEVVVYGKTAINSVYEIAQRQLAADPTNTAAQTVINTVEGN